MWFKLTVGLDKPRFQRFHGFMLVLPGDALSIQGLVLQEELALLHILQELGILFLKMTSH